MLDALFVCAPVILASILFEGRPRLVQLTAAAALLAYSFWETLLAGGLGKMALDMVIVAGDGAPASRRQLAARAALKSGPWAVAFASPAGLLESTMIILGTVMTLSQILILAPSRRTLHDWLTGTAVARLPEDAVGEEAVAVKRHREDAVGEEAVAVKRHRDATEPVRTPWLAMWIRPRRTIRQVFATGAGPRSVWLAMLAGVALALPVINPARRPTPIAALLVALLIGPPIGLMFLYSCGLTTTWIGKLYGGRAVARRTRWALGWSSIPTIWMLPVWVVGHVVLGSIFRFRPADMASEVAAIAIEIFTLFSPFWQLAVTIACVAEVQRLPRNWRGVFGPALGLVLGLCLPCLVLILLLLFLDAVSGVGLIAGGLLQLLLARLGVR